MSEYGPIVLRIRHRNFLRPSRNDYFSREPFTCIEFPREIFKHLICYINKPNGSGKQVKISLYVFFFSSSKYIHSLSQHPSPFTRIIASKLIKYFCSLLLQANEHKAEDSSSSPVLTSSNKNIFQNSSISQTPTSTTENYKLITNKIYAPFAENTRNTINKFTAGAPAPAVPAECAVTSIAPHHREVITVRTPLPHNDQESCV